MGTVGSILFLAPTHFRTELSEVQPVKDMPLRFPVPHRTGEVDGGSMDRNQDLVFWPDLGGLGPTRSENGAGVEDNDLVRRTPRGGGVRGRGETN